MLPLDEATRGEPLQGLVGVDQREAERVGQMILGEREADAVVGDETDVARAHIEVQDVIGRALIGVPAADAQEMLVKHRLLARGEPGQIKGKARAALEYLHTRLRGKVQSATAVKVSTEWSISPCMVA